METEGSFQPSQVLLTCPYPEPDQSSPFQPSQVLHTCPSPEPDQFSPFPRCLTYTVQKSSKYQQYSQCTYNVTLRRSHATIVAVENKKCITYSEWVFVALGKHHAMRISHISRMGRLGGSTLTFDLDLVSLTLRMKPQVVVGICENPLIFVFFEKFFGEILAFGHGIVLDEVLEEEEEEE